MMARCFSRKSSRAARSMIAKSGFSFFQRETVEGCRHIRDAAPLSEVPVWRMTEQSASTICFVMTVGRPATGCAVGAVGAGVEVAVSRVYGLVFFMPSLYHTVFGRGGA